MTIIVTGGAGFIGSNFIFHMLNKYPDYRIVCLDCLTYAGNLSTLEPVMDNPNFRFVKESITDREAVYRLFEEEKPDVVVNFAAESHVDRSIENPEVFLTTNIIGTAVLMDACRKYGIHTVNVNEKIATEEFIRITGENEIDLSVWTVNEEGRFRELLELFFQAASLLIDTLRTFFLIVLSILGPISFALAVYDGFQSTLTTWLSRYICIYLWLPVGDLFGAILSRIQVLMLQQDIKQMQDPTFIPDASNSVYCIFMIIGIISAFPRCPHGLFRQAVRELTGRRWAVPGKWPETVRRQSVGQSVDR